jgi:hypothetical protein
MSYAWEIVFQKIITPTGCGEPSFMPPEFCIVNTEQNSITELGSTIGSLDKFKYTSINSVRNLGEVVE